MAIPNPSSTALIVISPFFLPGGGGKEVSIHQQVQAVHESHLAAPTILCFSEKKVDHDDFDKEYPVPIIRITNRIIDWLQEKINKANEKNHASPFMGGKKKLQFKEKIFSLLHGSFSTLFLFTNTRKISKKANQKNIVFHCHSIASILAALFCKKTLRQKKCSIIFINGFVYKKSGFKLLDRIISFVLHRADSCLCISMSATKALEKSFGIPQYKIKNYSIWINQKNLDQYLIPKKDLTVTKNNQKIQVLFVGRIVLQKGIQEIINLIEYIQEQGLSDKYHFTIIGSAEYRLKKKLEALAIKISFVEYLGYIPKPQLWEYYQKNDLFLMPSKWDEAAGNVILEAYSFGLPVVGSNQGGIPEYLKSFSFHKILPSFDPKDMLSVINQLHSEIQNKGWEAVWHECRKTITEKFSKSNAKIVLETLNTKENTIQNYKKAI